MVFVSLKICVEENTSLKNVTKGKNCKRYSSGNCRFKNDCAYKHQSNFKNQVQSEIQEKGEIIESKQSLLTIYKFIPYENKNFTILIEFKLLESIQTSGFKIIIFSNYVVINI